ncbi:aminotransferase class I/II-fold pyridoxal phosphate-dependent enzyme [Microbacterium paludicola]|uniref:Aminotransferase class I/II-fold pyridoxal phosphate-dependent enzyme n=1 Tax=Microbacterium paludicola TaxID=300019 RepID=A0A4Y9FSA0_9MICO|nr:aminotransferase class I/II-fold pyridoxal phosphate-dependent enzyme [Microbacterium paludicola]MBF0817180.1 aminotransferase class I/II-fold pyridoxal phosphate-dependent enzyme [Microbacterium paludicola]TFU32107.1 aminotransferase class I/II-fold pyridoxal phosphate-dependent enzyme [Microbacterium paludicola]
MAEIVDDGVQFRRSLEAVPAFRRALFPEGRIRAGLNESHLPPIEGLLEAIVTEVPLLHRYGGPGEAAIEAVAEAHGRDVDEVLLGAGSSALIHTVIGSVCEPGDEVLFSWLTFEGYLGACHAAGAVPVPVPWTAEGGHDVDALLASVTERTRVVVISTPNNPSGTPLWRTQFDQLAAQLPPRVIILLDEAYSEFGGDPDAFYGTMRTDLPENAVVLKTLSKACGLASLRAGFLLGAPRIVDGVSRMRAANAVSRLAQAGMAYCYSPVGRELIAARVDAIVTERRRIEDALQQRGIPAARSEGNFVWLPAGERALELFTHVADAGILARAYEGYGLRYTVDTVESNDLFVEAVAGWWTARSA